MNQPSSYDDIVSQAYTSVEVIFGATTLKGRSLNFRYGDCTITCDDRGIGKHTQGLSTRQDWIDICTVVMNFWSSSRHKNIHLDIYRNYFGLLTRRITDESFASAKRTEIFNLMQTAFDGREYISRTDLSRVASKDMIQEIIIDDPTIEPAQKEDFIQEVEKKARNLLTLCVYAQLRMECLRELLVKHGLSDETFPIEKKHRCHLRCGPNFNNLLKSHGGFNAAVFFKPGEHKKLHKGIVVPIHYRPREDGPAPYTGEGRTTMSEKEGKKDHEEEDNPEKKAAHCGSGAYSNVYRVRIDPAHHKLTKVWKQPSSKIRSNCFSFDIYIWIIIRAFHLCIKMILR